MSGEPPVRVVILGGGFAGVNTAVELERAIPHGQAVEITIVNRDNFVLFTPMLHEVAASDLDLTHIVTPIRRMVRRAVLFVGEIEEIDLVGRRVMVRHAQGGHEHVLEYDHLVRHPRRGRLGIGCQPERRGDAPRGHRRLDSRHRGQSAAGRPTVSAGTGPHRGGRGPPGPGVAPQGSVPLHFSGRGRPTRHRARLPGGP